ncbi:uncharacterized protein LOC106868175 [Octopus bimaculoides]|nr:uncharacterized protein LOC106868175 [Octopus bimaculoides]|eukprot:XP_014768805.1 PREDICTED: uncharacterized protein LOC106868175 [Octopus bimaculoides]
MATFSYLCRRLALDTKGLLITTLRTYYILGIFTVTLTGALQCPKDFTQKTTECLADYTRELNNVENNEYKLLTGIEVEAIRAFCSSYQKGMKCIEDFKSKCSRKEKPRILINLSQNQRELNKLCEDDRLYEKYARYQTCFILHSDHTENCFSKITKKTVTIFTKLKYPSDAVFCSNVKRVHNCIENTITDKCTKDAGKLVEYLLTPMIMKSAQCALKDPVTTTSTPTTTRSTTHVRIIVPADRREETHITNGYGVTILPPRLFYLTFFAVSFYYLMTFLSSGTLKWT